ncbi:YcaO-like family protein, partial [bacterium]|nr:YcaO-like family protein [bacterium]
LSEIIERYVKNKIIAEEISLPEVPGEILAKFPEILNVVDKLEEIGLEILIHDASLGGQFPVINITLLNPDNGTCFAAFGAHPQFEVALQRTLTELFQGRSLEQLNEFRPPSFDSETVAEHYNLENHFIDSDGLISWKFFNKTPDFEFEYWNYEGTTKQEVDFLSKIIFNNGFDIFITEYNFLEMYSCRIVVPGMSEIYPVDDLVWNNKNEGVFFRDDILNLKNLNIDQLKKISEKIETYGLNDNQLVCEFVGIAADKNSEWEDFRLSELKGLIALAVGELKIALEYLIRTLLFGQISKEKKLRYSCLRTILEMELSSDYRISDYEKILSKLYGPVVYNTCKEILSGENIFSALYSEFKTHTKLVDAQRKAMV